MSERKHSPNPIHQYMLLFYYPRYSAYLPFIVNQCRNHRKQKPCTHTRAADGHSVLGDTEMAVMSEACVIVKTMSMSQVWRIAKDNRPSRTQNNTEYLRIVSCTRYSLTYCQRSYMVVLCYSIKRGAQRHHIIHILTVLNHQRWINMVDFSHQLQMQWDIPLCGARRLE
jgi:hypothetical protein